MKRIWLLALISLLHFSCKQLKCNNDITKFAIEESIGTLPYFSLAIEKEVGKQGNKASDLKVLKDSQKLKYWRENYLKNKSKIRLMIYVDSITQFYSYFFKKEDKLANQISKTKQLFIESPDSVNTTNLLFWTFEGEEAIQEELASKVGSTTVNFIPAN